jgi:hypothetical protein
MRTFTPALQSFGEGPNANIIDLLASADRGIVILRLSIKPYDNPEAFQICKWDPFPLATVCYNLHTFEPRRDEWLPRQFLKLSTHQK